MKRTSVDRATVSFHLLFLIYQVVGKFQLHFLHRIPYFSRLFMVYWRDGVDGNDGTGRDDKTVVKMEPCSRPVPSRGQFHLPITRTVPSRRETLSSCTLPSGPVEEISLTVPSRRQNLPLPSRPVYKTYPYRPVPSSKPVHAVPLRRQDLSQPSNPAVKTCPYGPAPRSLAVTPSRQDAVTVKMPSPSRCREHCE